MCLKLYQVIQDNFVLTMISKCRKWHLRGQYFLNFSGGRTCPWNSLGAQAFDAQNLPFYFKGLESLGKERYKGLKLSKKYALLTKLVRSRWLDIGQVLSRPISSHLDGTSLVNKGFIKWPKDYAKRLLLLRDECGQSRAGKIGPSCPLGKPIRTQDSLHLARSRSQPYNNIS